MSATLFDTQEIAGASPGKAPSIVALDLSLTCTGVCDHGVPSRLIPPKGMNGLARIAWIRSAVLDLTTDDMERPRVGLCVIEGIAYSSKTAYASEIAGLGYVVRMALRDYGVRWTEVPPASLKQFATGKGNAGKDEVLAAVIRRYGYEGHDNNEADALGLYHLAMKHYLGGETTEAQRKALAKIAWPKIGEENSCLTTGKNHE